ncbi:MAG: peptide chain release factor N(5)-glutamine methyltransferase [Prevotellaceae bacterium]|jgi:release factor glutamine methyltransferase|nr:peptide chain release factor N(5)-glutamine methyltransferase [Prevotellaceae bacterium]
MSQTLQKFLNFARQKLSNIYVEQEAFSVAQLLLIDMLNISKSELYANKERMLTGQEVDRLTHAITELEKSKPVQYVLGKTEFYGLPFAVNESVLIPRQETEELVDWIVSSFKFRVSNSKFQILDIGTGSGSIAVALAKNLSQAQVTAYDISERALEVAKQNAKQNDVNITFEPYDILNYQSSIVNYKFDVIVSNPPYVCESEKMEMNSNVLQYEPHLALFVDDSNPLAFYNAIADFALLNLRTKGFLFFEINRNFSSQAVDMLQQKGFVNVELRNDINGNPRMIRTQYA